MKLYTYEKEGDQWRWHMRWNRGIRYYCTNSDGEGVFFVRDGNRMQLAGTLQFSVKGIKDATAKSKIRRFMKGLQK